MIHLISDIFDPSRGSEFQVAIKPLRNLISLHKNINFWYLERGDAVQRTQIWLAENNYEDRVTIHPVQMKFSDSAGNHRFRILFVLDLLRLYIFAIKSSDSESVIWKAGQVNITFNLVFLLLSRKVICGPISGLEYPPILAILREKSYSFFVRYFCYAVLIIIVKCILRVILTFKKNETIILCATKNDLEFIRSISVRNNSVLSYHYTEIDLETLLYSCTSVGQTAATRTRNVIWCGSFIDRKNPEFAITAALHACSSDPDIEFTFVGEGPLLNHCKDLALMSGYKDRLHFITFMPRRKLLDMLPQFDIAFVTSWREVNSVFIFEAISKGLLIVSPDLSGMRDLMGPLCQKYEAGQQGVMLTAGQLLIDATLIKYNDLGRKFLSNIYVQESNLIAKLFKDYE